MGSEDAECVLSMQINFKICLCCECQLDSCVASPAASHRTELQVSAVHELPARQLIHGGNSSSCYLAHGFECEAHACVAIMADPAG